MRKPDYKFYVDGVEVQPHYKALKKKYARESGQRFFRITLEGQIFLFGADYLLIKDSSIDEQHTFAIMKHNAVTGLYDYYFTSTFNKMDCAFDYDKRSCQLKLSAKDAYNDILNGYDNTYNLLENAPATSSITLYKRPLIQVYRPGSSTLSSFIGGEYWEQEVKEVIENEDRLHDYYHFAKAGICSEIKLNGPGIAISQEAYLPGGLYVGTGATLSYYSQADGKTYTFSQDKTTGRYKIRESSTGVCVASTSFKFEQAPEGHCFSADALNYILGGRFNLMVGDQDLASEYTTFWCSTEYAFEHIFYARLLHDLAVTPDSSTSFDLPVDDFVSDNRNYKHCTGMTGLEFIISSRTTSKPTPYGKNDDGLYFTDAFLPASTGRPRPLPLLRSAWVNSSIWFLYPVLYDIIEANWRRPYTLKDAYSLADVLKVLLAKLDPTITHEASPEYSQFLYGDNPLHLKKINLFITQKTNILKGEYDQAAQKAEISLADICNMLRDCFRCYWFIENGKFRIEHILWFMRGRSYVGSSDVQLNLTELWDQKNGKALAYASNNISYDKADLVGRYEFAWMDDVSNTFMGGAIDVKAEYIQKDKTENISASLFTTDIDYMMLSPESFSNDGFALLAVTQDSQGKYALPIPTLSIHWKNRLDGAEFFYDVTAQNGYLTWFYLQQYYMYDMPALSIEVDKGLTGLQAFSIKKCMAQKVTFPYEEDPDLYSLITTEQGAGQVESLAIDLDTRQVEAELVYTPA